MSIVLECLQMLPLHYHARLARILVLARFQLSTATTVNNGTMTSGEEHWPGS